MMSTIVTATGKKEKKWLDVRIKMERVTSAIKTVGAFGQDKLRSLCRR
jgi:hypothetical protein